MNLAKLGPTWLEERVETFVFWRLGTSGSSVMDFLYHPHDASVELEGKGRIGDSPLADHYRRNNTGKRGRKDLALCPRSLTQVSSGDFEYTFPKLRAS